MQLVCYSENEMLRRHLGAGTHTHTHTHTTCDKREVVSEVCVLYISKAVLSAAPSYLHRLQALPLYATTCTQWMKRFGISHNYMYGAHTNVYIIYILYIWYTYVAHLRSHAVATKTVKLYPDTCKDGKF